MQKPKRWQLLFWSAGLSFAFTGGIATVIDTQTREEFASLRSTIAGTLSGFFPFWTTFFVLFLAICFVCLLAFYYSVSVQHGSLLSKDGVLSFDREQHIAISVATLKSILSTLAKDSRRASELLFNAGELAGSRFGGAFQDIYVGQIEPHGNKPWSTLSDNEKLDAWERYDATGGWGQINAQKYESRSIVDVVYRHPTLYEGSGGELFSWLLAGYSKEVAQALLDRDLRFDPGSGFVRDEGILRLHYTY